MSRIRNVLATTALLTLVSLSSPGARAFSEDGLDALRFLAGAWGSEETVVEYWLPPLRGLMVGINRAPEGEGMPFFEYLRIEEREEGVFYIASPRGRGTTEFELTDSSGSRAVFENPEHDFPQKITYTRTGERLEAEVGGIRDGQWSAFTLRWSLVR